MRIMSAIHPTNNQKRVLAKIAASPNPKIAGEQISGDTNIVAARNMLMKLGMITFNNGEAALTDKGQQIANDENITDDSGQLTDVGQKLAVTDPQGQPDADVDASGQQPPTDDMSGDPFTGDPNEPDPAADTPPVGESFKLLKELLQG